MAADFVTIMTIVAAFLGVISLVAVFGSLVWFARSFHDCTCGAVMIRDGLDCCPECGAEFPQNNKEKGQ